MDTTFSEKILGGLPTGPVPPGRQKVGQGGGDPFSGSIDTRFYISVNFPARTPRPPKSGTPGLLRATSCNNARARCLSAPAHPAPPAAAHRAPAPPRPEGAHPAQRRSAPAAGGFWVAYGFSNRRSKAPENRMIAGFFRASPTPFCNIFATSPYN